MTDPNGSLDSRESTPINIYWLGLHFSQLSQLNLWENFRKPLTKRDLVLLRNLQSQLRPNAERQVTILENELKAMQNGKVELQAMFSLGHSYLSKVYLPLVIFHYQDFVPFL